MAQEAQPAQPAAPADTPMTDAPPAKQPPPTFGEPQSAVAAERAAVNLAHRVERTALPVKAYLEATVVPTLMAGMQALVRERPEDPVQWLAAYLLKHNPQAPQADK